MMMMMTMMKIEARLVLICCLAAAASSAARSPEIKLGLERPSLRLAVSKDAVIRCCYSCRDPVRVLWIQHAMDSNETGLPKSLESGTDSRVEMNNTDNNENKQHMKCSHLMIRNLRLSDTGLYKCGFSNTSVLTPGTYLQVYVPMRVMLNMAEGTKNSIITTQGLFLLLLVLLPGTFLICKSKGLNELEKRKDKEDENIYEGLNLDDCNSTYHQIQRSLLQGSYQDVMRCEEDDVQLEKP